MWLQDLIANTVAWAMSGKMNDFMEQMYIRRKEELSELRMYYDGNQRQPLKITLLGKNYNTITNLTGPIVDRSVFMLMGGGVKFENDESREEQEEIIRSVWKANKQYELLSDLAQFGGIYGTAFIKIIPGGARDELGNVTARLIALNPSMMTIMTAPDDIQNILVYVSRWNDGGTAYREITERQTNEAGETVSWVVRIEKANDETRGQWAILTETAWPYTFAPIAHCKNLPCAGNVYGKADIQEIIGLQDRYNEAQSNTNKILSLQAWAQKWIAGAKWPRVRTKDGDEYIDAGPDKALEFSDPNVKVGLLQPSGDLASSRQFGLDLRRDIFYISGTTDPETVTQRLGQLTNFGLRVMYAGELAKNQTKQLLYGGLLNDVNHRLLMLAGYTGENALPGWIEWADPLPQNDTEEAQVINQDVAAGLISKETAAKKRGYNWEQEAERMGEEKTEAANVGGNLIRDFLAGRGQ